MGKILVVLGLLPQARPVNYYFAAGPSGSVQSVNDSLLSPSTSKPGRDSYVIDYSTTSGPRSRWTGGPTGIRGHGRQ